MSTYTSDECMRMSDNCEDPDGQKYWRKMATSIAFNECVNAIWDEQRAERAERKRRFENSAPDCRPEPRREHEPYDGEDGGDG